MRVCFVITTGCILSLTHFVSCLRTNHLTDVKRIRKERILVKEYENSEYMTKYKTIELRVKIRYER